MGAGKPVSVVVVGSLNHDLAVRLPRLPRPDETLIARDIAEFRGGKGYNQATASARLGARVALIGCVGADGAGALLRDGLRSSGVDQTFLRTVGDHTGTAVPLVADTGDVSIIIVAGANAMLDASMVDAAAPAFAGAHALLLQGEVPIAASRRAAEIARGAGALVVVNPAPVTADSPFLLALGDYVVVNRDEAEVLGLVPSDRIVVTLGASGVRVAGEHVEPFPVETVVDPTGAGDAFCAAFAVALAEGRDVVTAARFGAAAGACAVTRLGAEPGLPHRGEVDARLAGSGITWPRP